MNQKNHLAEILHHSSESSTHIYQTNVM